MLELNSVMMGTCSLVMDVIKTVNWKRIILVSEDPQQPKILAQASVEMVSEKLTKNAMTKI